MMIPATDTMPDPTGLFTNVKADIQGDFRHLAIWSKTPELVQTNIPMELGLKAALHFGKDVDFVVARGYYGQLIDLQSRIYYAQVRTGDSLSFQVGRFLPDFGLNMDDHTALTRAPLGFSQGHETLNLQVHFENEKLIFSAAKTLGEDVLLSAGKGGLQYQDQSARERLILRGGIKWGTQFVTGASAAYDDLTKVTGLFFTLAPIKQYLYFMGEADQTERKQEAAVQKSLNYFARVGTEFARGFTLGADYSGEKVENIERSRTSVFLQIFPAPHFELKLESRAEEERKSYLLMTHLWI